MTGIVTAGVTAAVAVGASAYEMSKANSNESTALGMAQTTQGEQEMSFQQLQQLISNPSAFLNSPIFQDTLSQGLTGTARQMASQGYLNSGNEATALTQFGTSLASGELLSQEQLLASISGTGSASSPASSISAATGANAQSNQEVNQLLSSLTFAGGLSSGLYGGSGGGSPDFSSGIGYGTSPSGYGMGPGGYLLTSDRRLKKNIELVEFDEIAGLQIYKFHYLEEADEDPKRLGYMADEAREKYPEAVIEGIGGYLLLDYRKIPGKLADG